MADVTWGVKVPEELKEQINRLMQESGLQGKDFMQQMINLYVLEIAKDRTPEIAQDIRELQSLTQRINDIYLNMGYRMENLYETQRRDMDRQIKKKDQIINELDDKLKDNKTKYDKLVELYNEKVNTINELNETVKQLTDNNENLKALNDQYKANISNLNDKIQEYNEVEKESRRLTTENTVMNKEVKDLKVELDNRNARIAELEKKLQELGGYLEK